MKNAFRATLQNGIQALIAVALAFAVTSIAVADDRSQFFEKHIRPALITHCYECHSNANGKSEGGLLLDSRPAVQRGGDSGAAIQAGSPDDSLLIEAIRYESFEMPPGKRLDDKTIALFEEWIRQGAIDPRDEETTASATHGIDIEEGKKFWSFQPRAKAHIPDLEPSWGASPIDRFVVAKLQEHELEPADEADRSTWLRRVTFDLIGLPPTVGELEAFLSDENSDAYERVVERLLDSPHYGERWGRYWLDLARYADSNGADENHKYPVAWRYRDYVVSAFNADKPYDRMVREQLAGDLLPAESETERRDNLTATGFLLLGPKMLAEQDKEKLVADIVDEQLDTFGKVFLGLTLGCARCHDHKFDPISAEDYYSLAGVFHSTKTMEHLDHVSQWNERELPDQLREQEIAKDREPVDRAEDEVAALDTELREYVFEWKMKVLSSLMLKEIGAEALASSTDASEKTDADPVSEKQSTLLKVFLDDVTIFRVWQDLHQSTGEQFATNAKQHWQAATQPSKKSRLTAAQSFELRLTAQPLPHTPAELAAAYIAALRQSREEAQQGGPDNDLWDHLFSRNAVLDRTRWTSTWVTKSHKRRIDELTEHAKELKEKLPKLDKIMAADDTEVKLVSLHVRGDHLQLSGEPLPREVPKVLASASLTEFPSNSSGRLELANWLTQPDHPLTARVMVNRIWQGHFGFGLVRSPSNFGIRGEEPTHPELLDWLAEEFVRGDWSIKRLHRMIVLSSTYRMVSSTNSKATLTDPENRCLSHFPRRRLELEPIRDSLLAIAGQLDRTLGGETKLKKDSKYMSSDVAKTVFDAHRRTIYIPINRAALNAVFSTFDYVDPATSLEQRPTTTVPHQTLFLMNHPLVMDAGQHLAARVLAGASDTARRIELAYKTTFARSPTEEECFVADQYISARIRDADGQESDAELTVWTSYCRSLLLTNEFLYVE